MWCVRVILLVMFTSVCSGCLGPTWQATAVRPESVPAFLHKSSGVTGVVPLVYVLEEARRQELLDQWPSRPDPSSLTVDCKTDLEWGAVMSVVEIATGWVYDPGLRAFTEGQATHRVDAPDSAGRPSSKTPLSATPRPMVALGVRFVRVEGGVSNSEIGGGGKYVEFWGSGPAGTVLSWSSTTERSFETGVVDPANPVTPVVRTDRRIVPAGLQVEALTSRIVGGMGRVDGTVTVSAFTGISVDRVMVTVPLQADVPRYKWCKVFRSTALDANARLTFENLGLDLSAGGDDVEVWVRID